MRKILLTGFEPFGSFESNPTQYIAKALDKTQFGDAVVESIVLPVEFDKGPAVALKAVHDCKPDIVIATGMAAGRDRITPERVAINWGEGKTALGFRESGKLEQDGPDGLFSRLPLEELVSQLEREGIWAKISNTAGTYVCNAVMYTLLHHTSIPAGFIHVPAMDGSETSESSWPLSDLQQGMHRLVHHLVTMLEQ
ncbi:peptidase C15 [Bacillaceae bacterium SIJ1]|uniref:pyroglutamyl-peptidase I family protein n=1 Tax=Litoribacterium kuwaitense TaxID=1398745 RepID=UPI0013EAE7A4|nr:peptidase C15 [Litoribacterium kuwaitense]NGP44747.1 peptidase C15 [Litoribacterium kuwaitense]